MNKLRTLLSNIYHLTFNYSKVLNVRSFYPNDKLKSKSKIFIDHAISILKYGQYEKYYFLYGFDRVAMTNNEMRKYISPYGKFARIRDSLNYHPENIQPYNYVIILNDKFVFERYLTSLGISTPKNKFIIDSNTIFDLEKNKTIKFDEFIQQEHDLFCKPFSGMLGQGIFDLTTNNNSIFVNGNSKSREELQKYLFNKGGKLVCQERIKQHSKMNEIYSKSVNTLRIHTVITTSNEVTPFSVVARFGVNDNIVDNWALGGLIVGVDMQTGKLKNKGFYKPEYGTSTEKHPNSNTVFKDYKVPFFEQAIQLVQESHKYLNGIHSIGWDVAITEKGPTIIEANHRWEISLCQATHGGLSQFIKEHFKEKK